MNRELARLKQVKSAHQVALVREAMISAFGGLDGFSHAWTACLDRDLKRGGFAALRHLEAMLRRIRHCEDLRPIYGYILDDERGARSTLILGNE